MQSKSIVVAGDVFFIFTSFREGENKKTKTITHITRTSKTKQKPNKNYPNSVLHIVVGELWIAETEHQILKCCGNCTISRLTCPFAVQFLKKNPMAVTL